ncbi:MAG TPA: hypothetical protein VG225_13880 [Terracidiphilus sp.]|jgi:hypothetical protein|nr:hypothetical protein [Terracidiphilus sp.]
MILLLLEILAFAAIAYYFVRWRAGVRRRNHQSWESLLARLRPDWSARELSDQFLWKEGLNATPDDAWQRMEGPRGLWVMYQNARVMLEMADFAARHDSNVDRLIIETLRSDAMQIRVCVLMALAQYGFTQASEGVRVNAFRAAALYSGMAARLTALLQDHAAAILPDFVAAM